MTLPADIDDFLDPILRTFEGQLTADVQGHLVTGYLKGSTEMLEWGRTKTTDMPIYHEGPPMGQAMSYAQKHTATLVKGIDDETREQMRGIIKHAIKEKRGVPGLSRDLRNQISSMSRVRSKMIARTETADALESAFMDRAHDMKVTGKESVWPGGDCDICEENANAGVIPIDKPLPSGHMRPPYHPNCRCALAPVMLKKGAAEERNILQKAEQSFGNKYGNAKTEYGRGIDALGREILTKRGTAQQVKYSAADLKKLQNAKSFIHNHPNGGTFSPDDIGFAGYINTGKMVAIDTTYKYVMTPIESWAGANKFYSTMKMQMKWIVTDIRRQYRLNPDMGAPAANTLLRDRLHHLVEELAPKYGLKYGRELL